MSAKIAYVRWFDSSITREQTIFPDDELAGISEMESVGLLVHEDKTSVTIALDRSLNHHGLRCTLCIPRVNIRKIKRFRV